MKLDMPRSDERRKDLENRVAKLEWWHKIDLGDGIITPGPDPSLAKLATLHLPLSLKGKTVLDIGAYDGFFSFEAERRGAARVLALDKLAWERGERSGRACFELAREALGSSVEDVYQDVMDLSPDELGTFDVVLFLGVLYHLRHPLLALERVASVVSETLIVETQADLLPSRAAAMRFYPHDELNRDASNWWGPNEAAMTAMLREVGFARIETVYRRPLAERTLRALRLCLPPHRLPLLNSLRQGRLVLHASR